MKFLVLGGTAWLGRTVAARARAAGHDVVCVARGSAPSAEGVRLIRTDRDAEDAYRDVVGETWDAVLDVARQPGHVRRAVAALEPVSGRYLFVSTCNVYADQRQLDQDEDAALLPALAADQMESMAQYGEAKVACELAVTQAFGSDRTLIARPGLIGGPGDTSGRSGYWPWRFAHPADVGGAVLTPAEVQIPSAMIDVRDLAAWLVSCAERHTSGVFNAQANRRPLGDHVAVARAVAGHSGPVRPASRQWLLEHGVQSWAGPKSLPLWVDDLDWCGMNARETRRAVGAGLLARPLEETLADTLAWENSLMTPPPHGAGLADDEERELLAALG
jgi:nucleoside-diphosphate-sugar epimerase